jgi:hypothetical protein
MTIYDGYRSPRWHCHACGAGGTAIDLYATATRTAIGDAIRALAQRTGLEREPTPTPRPKPTRAQTPPAANTTSTVPDAAIERYVAASAELIGAPQGRHARQYLRDRGLANRELLRINRIGYDPGPLELPRPAGLPSRGRGIVLPVLDHDQRAIFCTTRYLDEHASGRRYDNASGSLAANPKVATIRPIADTHPENVIVTEGIIDALTVARHGYTALAVLGAANARQPVRDQLIHAHHARRVMIAFDADASGRAATLRLAGTLNGATTTIIVGLAHGDLNDQAPAALARLLSSASSRNVDDWSTTVVAHDEHARRIDIRPPRTASAPTLRW